MKMLYQITSALLLAALTGCMPMTYPPGAKNNTASLSETVFLTEDGANLPIRHWLPKTDPLFMKNMLIMFKAKIYFHTSKFDYFVIY